jgi:protein-tyrosine phosphatase
MGSYHEYHNVDWASVERLVFVCKGNICRSAFAEAVARSLGIEAISCGLQTIENAPANAEAIRTAKKMGIDLSMHRTTPIMYLELKKTDLLIAMEPRQARFLQRNMGRPYQCTLLGIWMNPRLPYIHDPHGSSPVYFEKCFSYIKSSVHGITKKIQ